MGTRRPPPSVTGRTGAGKSPLSRALAAHLQGRGLRVGVLRHPMPYGDLRRQAVQRFATEADLDHHECTVEEREEYQPYVEQGMVVWAGVDYERILRTVASDRSIRALPGCDPRGLRLSPDGATLRPCRTPCRAASSRSPS